MPKLDSIPPKVATVTFQEGPETQKAGHAMDHTGPTVRFANLDSPQNKRNASSSANPEIRRFFNARKALELGEAEGILGLSARTGAAPGQPASADFGAKSLHHQERQMACWLKTHQMPESLDMDMIDKGMEYMHRQRLISLKHIIPNRQIVPKDLSVRIKTAHMSFRSGKNEKNIRTNVAYIRKMLEVAGKKGFTVMVTASREGADRLQSLLPKEEIRDHLVVQTVPDGAEDTWTEDSGRFNIDGKLSVPATINNSDDLNNHRLNIYRARAFRFYPDQADHIHAFIDELETAQLSPLEQKFELKVEFPKIDFDDIGLVAHGSKTAGPISRGLLYGEPLREDYTYQEGGNTLVGLRADGTPFGLVGRDSAEFSRSHLADELEMEIDDQLLKRYLAADLGIDASEVFLIEQPGAFHLDMHMALMGPGQVIVNSPVQAAELATGWIEEMKQGSLETPEELTAALERMHEDATRMQGFVDLVVADLKSAGLDVRILPLVFDGPVIGAMNFVNGEGGTGPDGKPFFITNGGTIRAQQFIESTFREMFNAEVFFVDGEAVSNSLERDGGLGCRVTMQAEIPPR